MVGKWQAESSTETKVIVVDSESPSGVQTTASVPDLLFLSVNEASLPLDNEIIAALC